MRAPKVIMALRLSMLLSIISIASSRSGSFTSVHVHAFELSWLMKWGRAASSL
jgi:hypothetical protein